MLQTNFDLSRINMEFELAKQVQTRLLPQQPPIVGGLDIWAGLRSAIHIGGDFYDFFTDCNHHFIFLVGDISGKGMSAAMMMPMTRLAIRTSMGFPGDCTPEDIISRSNHNLYEDYTTTDIFASIFVASYDPDSRGLIYANAGQSPVIFCPVGGGPVFLEADDAPMGVHPQSMAKNHFLQLHPGDVLIAGTDGLIDCHYPGESLKLSYDRLLWKTRQLASYHASAIAESLFNPPVSLHHSANQDDDQTLVVIKCV